MSIRAAVQPRVAALGMAAVPLLLSVLLAACGGPSTVTSESTPEPTPARTPSATPSESGPAKEPGMPPADDEKWKPLIRIDAAKGDPAATTVVVTYTLPTPCSPGLRQAEVDERSDAVAVKLHRSKPQPADDKVMCAQVIQEKTVDIQLDEPLGDRQLVDASSGKVVKVSR
jgi:Na+-transporting methylmalonyl-CoA/oxaloacetate decarboxylase gamma subunit